ncbi:MAG TPA: hypothetical protein VEB19_12700 [Gemmatimonadaceae bacterium]|nr:hypothetical protein [Gemmatimonadaceae bacterium]
MTPGKIVVSAATLVVLVGIAVVLVGAPLHAPYTPAECAAAYAGARSRADTAQIDLHRLKTTAGIRDNRRCGSTRAVASTAGSEILVP